MQRCTKCIRYYDANIWVKIREISNYNISACVVTQRARSEENNEKEFAVNQIVIDNIIVRSSAGVDAAVNTFQVVCPRPHVESSHFWRGKQNETNPRSRRRVSLRIPRPKFAYLMWFRRREFRARTIHKLRFSGIDQSDSTLARWRLNLSCSLRSFGWLFITIRK